MRRVSVRLPDRGYEVVVERGLTAGLGSAAGVAEYLGGRDVFVASDRTVDRLYGAALDAALAAAGARLAGRAVMDPGEDHKNLDSLELIWEGLVTSGLDRGGALVALGGGVVGDVAGFAAATYLRGVDWVQVPTTLLAMVDSSVGGKTAIDHRLGKNLFGAFHQPRAVAADLAFLDTLPRREALSGLAEVLKAALIGDRELFELLAERGPGVLEDACLLEEVVARAVAVKARIVEADEREGGARALLNLGHTLGHALEAVSGYGTLTHGEAVATGLAFVVRLSRRLGLLRAAEADRVLLVLEAFGYDVKVPHGSAEEILDAMRFDKKRAGGLPRWVLLKGIADAEYGHRVDPAVLADLLSGEGDHD